MAQVLEAEKRRKVENRVAGEVSLRIETAGYGGVPVRAIVPGGALSSIERGDLPVETEMRIRVPGYDWRVVGMRISPSDKGAGVGEASPARLTVPGYGTAPLPMRFLKRTL